MTQPAFRLCRTRLDARPLPWLITPTARAAAEWRRSRNGVDVAVTVIVRFQIHHTLEKLKVCCEGCKSDCCAESLAELAEPNTSGKSVLKLMFIFSSCLSPSILS